MTNITDLLCSGSGHVVVLGDGGSPLADGLRDLGNEVEELQPSDFQADREEMADVVAVLPDCRDPLKLGATAAACARCVWFQDRPAPPGVQRILEAAGVPVYAGKDLLTECRR